MSTQQSWARTLFSKGKWYIISSAFTKGLALLLLPVYTRYLSPADYGTLSTLTAMSQFLPVLISLYLDSAFGRYYFEYKDDHEKLKSLFSSIYWFVVIWGGIIVFVAISSSPVWVKYFAKDVPLFWVILSFVPALLSQIGTLGVVFLRQSLQARTTATLEITTSLIGVAVTLPLLILAKLGVEARLWGAFTTAVFLFAYYTVYFRRHKLLSFKIDASMLKTCLVYSIPLIPNIAGGWIAQFSDRLVLARYTNPQSVGVYSLAATLGTLMYVIQDALTQVSSPLSMSNLVSNKNEALPRMAKLSLFLWGMMLLADLMLTLFTPELLFIFATKKYESASTAVGIMGFAYVLSAQNRVFSDIVSYHKQTWVISSGGILMASVSLGLNLLLVPRFGWIASSWSFVFATLSMVLWVALWGRRWEKIPLKYSKYCVLFLLFAAAQYVNYKLCFPAWDLIGLCVKIGLSVAFGLSVYFLIGKKNAV
jgi:O-antigen/teichoic acid export membrane protein